MTEEQTTQNLYMQLVKEQCEVDSTKEIDYPPAVLSYGEKRIETKNGEMVYPITICTAGNISYLTAPPKSKKTFFISLLASVYLDGGNNFGGKLKGHTKEKTLIHIDTEQGVWHASRTFRRPIQMSKKTSFENYKTFALRTIGYKDRLDFIEYILKENPNTGLLLCDGVADLVADVNDLTSANECVARLMKLSTEHNVHILCVIHQNFGSPKLGTGHLGSFLEKKAETCISLDCNNQNKSWVTVKCERSRGYSFETFSFTVNNHGLPQIVSDIYDPLEYYVPNKL